MPPAVSVLVPTYNHAPFVRETLDSVLGQDYEPMVVLVGDDGSVDGTGDIVAQYVARDARVRLLGSSENRGIAENFSRLLTRVETPYYCWLGGDDVMLPGKLARQVAIMEAHPGAAASVHDAEVFVSETGEVLGRFSEVFNGRRGCRSGGPDLLLDPTYYTLPSTMMVRTACRPAGGYDRRLRFSNEWIFDIETFANGGCIGFDDVLVRYRRHEGSVTSSDEHRAIKLEENLLALGLAQARLPELTAPVRLRRTSLLLSEALAAWSVGDRRRAGAYVAGALRDGGPLRVARVATAYARLVVSRRRLGVAGPA